MANRQKRIAKESSLLQKKERFKKRFKLAKRQKKIGLQAFLEQLTLGKMTIQYDSPSGKDAKFDPILKRFKTLETFKKQIFLNLLQHPKINFEDSACYHLFLDILKIIHRPVRNIDNWKAPKSKSDESIFKSLFLHLFVSYRLPAVVQNQIINILFVDGLDTWKGNLLVGLAKGYGLHTIPNLPFDCNSKMNFHLCQAPEDYSLEQALAWAKLRSSNTGYRISNILARKLFKGTYRNWPKWIPAFLGFLQRNPTITPSQINTLLSFIVFQKEQKYLMSFPEVSYKIEVEPLFPSFRLTGRSVNSVLKLVDQWKEYLRILRETGANGTLPLSTIAPFTFRSKLGKTYTFRQIRSIKDLITEGKRMHHCVGGYSKQCINEISSIWAVQIRFPKGLTKNLLTIELLESNKSLDQIQGMCNRNPSREEMEAVRAWAAQEKMTICNSYL